MCKVANLSLSSSKSSALNDAVASSINAGLFVAAIATGLALQKRDEHIQMLLKEESEHSRNRIDELRKQQDMTKTWNEKVWSLSSEEWKLTKGYMSSTAFARSLRSPGEELRKFVRKDRGRRNGSGLWQVFNYRHQRPQMVKNDRSLDLRRHVLLGQFRSASAPNLMEDFP